MSLLVFNYLSTIRSIEYPMLNSLCSQRRGRWIGKDLARAADEVSEVIILWKIPLTNEIMLEIATGSPQ